MMTMGANTKASTQRMTRRAGPTRTRASRKACPTRSACRSDGATAAPAVARFTAASSRDSAGASILRPEGQAVRGKPRDEDALAAPEALLRHPGVVVLAL